MAQFMCYCYSFIYIINICFGWNKNSFADYISITVEFYMNCCIFCIITIFFFYSLFFLFLFFPSVYFQVYLLHLPYLSNITPPLIEKYFFVKAGVFNNQKFIITTFMKLIIAASKKQAIAVFNQVKLLVSFAIIIDII